MAGTPDMAAPPDAGSGSANNLAITACDPTDLASAVSQTLVPVEGSVGEIRTASTPSGGVVAAWVSSPDTIHLTVLDGSGGRLQPDLTVQGNNLIGLTATPDSYSMLVGDFTPTTNSYIGTIRLVRVDATSGAVLLNQTLLGGCDLSTVGCEAPLESYAGYGRLIWTGEKYAAYFATQKHLAKQVGTHQGDALRFLDWNGTLLTGGWDYWIGGAGLDHSLDQRLAFNGSQVGALAWSDCNPQRGVIYNGWVLVSGTGDSSYCGSGSTRYYLGSLVPSADGFWFSYTTNNQRASSDVGITHINNAGAVISQDWLTSTSDNETDPHLAAFGGGFLSGWTLGYLAPVFLARLDSNGNRVGAPQQISASFEAGQDWVTFSNGDVGWVTNSAWGGGLNFVRVHACN